MAVLIRLLILACLGTLGLTASLSAAIELSESPVSTVAASSYPTGVGWADVDGDGWHDLVLTCGLDVAGKYNYIYKSSSGYLPLSQAWTSIENHPSAQMCIGDFNNDGFPGFVVSNTGTAGATGVPQPQAIYLNTGGVLSESASVLFPEANSFSCAIGDPDGDGDLDVVFGQGKWTVNSYEKVVMYENNDGIFSTTPCWESDDGYFAADVEFGDIDADGDLDLVVGDRGQGLLVFYNHDGTLETSPSWQTTAITGGRQMAFGDIDDDGYLDLAVAGIGQSFFVFKNLGGVLETMPSWMHSGADEPSAVAWGDLDQDGDLDLAIGGWQSPLGVYENVGGVLNSYLSWTWTGGTNRQQIVLADFDNDHVIDTQFVFAGDSTTRLFYVDHQPVHEIMSVEIDGVPLGLDQYCYDDVDGWVSLSSAPLYGQTMTIHYSYSQDLDLTVTTTSGALLFTNDKYQKPGPGTSVLLMMDNNLGGSYDVVDAKPNIRQQLEDFGWNIHTTALYETVSRCFFSEGLGLQSVPVDYLISEIPDVTNYDIVCLLPGADGLANIMADSAALALITDAADNRLVVGAWCRSVRVLAAADLIDGLDVVGNSDYQADYEAAGATYLGNDRPPVVQGNIVTSVRSLFYRTEMCEALRAALPPSISEVAHSPEIPTQWDPVLVTARVADFTTIASAVVQVDTGDGYFAVPMYDDGAHQDGLSGDSIYAGLLPRVSEDIEVRFYIEATDSVGVVTTDPASAPEETYRFAGVYAPPIIHINEVMAVNSSSCIDDYGEYDSWFELYNAGSYDIDLSGMYLSNDPGNPTAFQVSDVSIPGFGYVVFWADGQTEQGNIHTSFELDPEAAEIGVFDTDQRGNQTIATGSFISPMADVSSGQMPDGSDNWVSYYLPHATPGAPNIVYDCGDIDANLAGPDISDLTFLVDYLFGGGIRPPAASVADINPNGALDISDLTYMADYLFGSGPAPNCP